MFNQDIFIFEFISGGGFNQAEILSSLFCEGYAMLRTTIEDFKDLGFHITTLLDSRIAFLSHYIKADVVKSVELGEDYFKKYIDCVRDSEYCFIIAPEFSNLLYNLTKIVKQYKKKLLSIDLNGVALGASKLETYKFFIANEINTPKSYFIPFKGKFLDLEFILQKFNQLNSSIVIKPDDGVGAESIFYFENKDDIFHFFESSNKIFDTNRKYLIQEYIEGEPMSVSIINDQPDEKTKENKPKILSINVQNLQITDNTKDSTYLGGFTPVDQFEQLKTKLEDILKCVDLSAFKGYFGIDFVKKADNSLSFIEINPRLTTSYIGIRNIIEFNPMALLLNQTKKLPKYVKFVPRKFSEFTQIKLKYDGEYTSGEINNLILPKLINLIPEIITPPFMIEGVNKSPGAFYSCFIATKSNDIPSSKHRISQINQIFGNYEFRIIK